MRIIANFSDNAILQVERTPPVGDPVPFNGKYSIDVPEGTSVEVGPTSYVLNGFGNVDSGSVVDQAMNNLLSLYPDFDNLHYNYLITDDHAAELDLTASFSDGVTAFNTRAQSGRGGSAPAGLAPNSVALLPQNNTTTPARPGVLVTDTIDISATLPLGADVFRVWWKIYQFETTEDVLSDYGAGGMNSAAIRSIVEVDQEHPDLTIYVSNDDGSSYVPVERLRSVSFCDRGTDIRLAFVNTGNTKLYVAAYAFLF